MQLRITDFEDSASLSDFFKNFPIDGWAKLKIDRRGQFFGPYEVMSEQFVNYALTDKNEIHGTATFMILNQGFQGITQPIAWGRDLRISNNRKAIMGWSNHFLPVMNEIRTAFKTKHIFTILNLNDSQLMKTFVRGQSIKRNMPRYHLYRRLNLVTLHGKFPWVSNPLPHLKIVRGTQDWLKPLTEYVTKKSRSLDFSINWDEANFHERINKLTGLRIHNFYIAVNHANQIVGCAAPWSPGAIQELIPMSYSPPAHNFRQFLKFGARLGWTHPLTKPSHRLDFEAPLNFKFLNFLYAENEDIFESLLFEIFEDLPDDEFLVYTQLRSEIGKRPPKGWISSQSPYGIFALLHPDEEVPSFLHPSNDRAVELDPFFII